MCEPSTHTKWHDLIKLLRDCIREEAEIKAKEILKSAITISIEPQKEVNVNDSK